MSFYPFCCAPESGAEPASSPHELMLRKRKVTERNAGLYGGLLVF
jgi:hypothetical protein